MIDRRQLLLSALASTTAGCFRLARPADPDAPLSPEARALIDACWDGIDPARVIDCHAHLVGLGKGGTGAYATPRFQSCLHPIESARFSIYTTAAGVKDVEQADAEYVTRLVQLVRAEPKHGRLLLLAFDRAYREDGAADEEATEFYTPDAYVLRIAKEYPDCFVAAASVHPYRKDALTALESAVAQGAMAVKWLPNAQRMDPSSPRCDDFYRKLAELNVPLLSHAGEEKAVDADEAQRFGNPLHFRRPLDLGVKVIIAHCASLGENPDLDAPGDEKPWVENYRLFLRLIESPTWKGRLFGDISALAQYNRCEVIQDVWKRESLGGRLINGSDYPLPAIHALVRTGKLQDLGYLTPPERELLNEIDRHNPLAFDFALKRTMAVREGEKTWKLAPEVFMAPPGLFPGLT